MLVANRPLVSVAVAAPFILYSLLRLLWLLGRGLYAYRIAGGQQKRLGASLSEFTFALKPLVVLGLIAILYALLFPASNYAVVGDPADNLYTRIWSYDTIGFGEGHGRYSGREIYKLADNGIKIYMRSYTGHSPDRGWRNTKRDFKCYSRDLFGWVRQPDDPPREPKLGNDCLMDSPGYSWALLPFSALFLLITTPLLPGKTSFRRWASYGWRFLEKSRWTVLLLAVAGCIILVQILYWIGAGIYSARYYYEATAALAIVSGAGISGLARFADYFRLRYGVYALLGLAVAFSVIGYSPKRLDPLRGYGRVTRAPLEQMEAMRLSPDTPVLVVAYGNHHWRDLAPFMALTDPHTENEIIGLRDPDANTLDDLIKRYPDRQVFLIVAQKLMLYDPENLPDPPEAGG
jgi:hypothetical protein